MTWAIEADTFAFIEKLDRLSRPAEVLEAVKEKVSSYGCDQIVVTGRYPAATARFGDMIIASGLRDEYVRLYDERDYLHVDPVALVVKRSTRPFQWAASAFHHLPEVRGREVMQRAADFGMTHGLAVPKYGPDGFDGCVAVSGMHIDLPSHLKPSIHLMALYAFERLRALISRRDTGNDNGLSHREKEVLTWAAQGKSSWEIASILSITQRTVEAHAKNAAGKLRAANRTQAVAIALRERLIAI